jgi:hypothetical protein
VYPKPGETSGTTFVVGLHGMVVLCDLCISIWIILSADWHRGDLAARIGYRKARSNPSFIFAVILATSLSAHVCMWQSRVEYDDETCSIHLAGCHSNFVLLGPL